MNKTFREIEKEQFNVRIPGDLIDKILARSNRKGWGIGRTVTEAVSIGLGIDPAEYGIEADTRQPA